MSNYPKEFCVEANKQLELQEMKNGKKWNGEKYDDWLTADGLTWNELVEHDASEIEYNCRGRWRKNLNSNEDTKGGIGLDSIEKYRLKPDQLSSMLK